jgi:hypothetical protein
VSIDLARLYRQAAAQDQRRTRRWRRTAILVCGAAAAVVALVIGLRLEVHLEAHQVVVRWANIPAPPEMPPTPAPQAPTVKTPELLASASMQEQVEVLSELVQGQHEELIRLQTQLDELNRQMAAGTQRWLTTERDVAALSTTQALSPAKGNLP